MRIKCRGEDAVYWQYNGAITVQEAKRQYTDAINSQEGKSQYTTGSIQAIKESGTYSIVAASGAASESICQTLCLPPVRLKDPVHSGTTVVSSQSAEIEAQSPLADHDINAR